MEHALKYLKIPIDFVQNLKAFQCDKVAMKRIVEGNIIDFGQIRYSSFIVYLHGIAFLATILSAL